MNEFAELAVVSLLALLAPTAIHFGALGGAPLRPSRLNSRARGEVLLFRHLHWIMAANGVFLAAALLSWRLNDGSLWLVPAVIAIPIITAQLVALLIAKTRDVGDGGSRG